MGDILLPLVINGKFGDVPALTAPDIGKALTVASTSAFTYSAFATSAEVTTAIATHAALTATHGATGAIVGTTNTQTLTNKTLTAPVIATIVNTGTLTLPTSTDTLVGRATTDTLTNKTLTLPTIGDFTNAQHNHSNAAGGGTISGGGVTDHGALTGLPDDDHAQYALLAGRSGGQFLIGGTTSSDNLTLQSSSHATKGKILFGISAYDEANNRLGVGTASPAPNAFWAPGRCVHIVDTTTNLPNLRFQSTGVDFTFACDNSNAYFYLATNSGMRFFANAAEFMRASSAGYLAVGGGHVATAALDLDASTTARASLRVRSGVAPTSPNEGDLWYDGTNLRFRDSTTTRTITWT